ncbi:HAD-IIB family hydrolase [Tunturiibacter lichenicola]|uniref:HAD-IIB family hydrolase n=1 Tax=Tunturiibacter lichenicola TaxID=2051959 RepID=UPI0021B226CF|nr:HAD family hydrolase [Edaphobacter lichenicola]
MHGIEAKMRLIAVDMDGTLVGPDGRVSERNLAAMKAAERSGVQVVVATGRRHCYAMRVLRGLGLREEDALISSNGTVTRTIGAKLLDRTLLPLETARWLCRHVDEFRNALVITFDKVGPDGEDARGALVVEDLAELNASIGKWMVANEPYIERVVPIEEALEGEAPIQMMLCGTVERMRRAEARLLEHPGVSAVGVTPLRKDELRRLENLGQAEGGITPQERASGAEAALHRTEYPERDLSIVDILPAGCSKGSALLRLAEGRGIMAEEILAIGDNWNDVSMLEVAGRAVLMGNAPDDLKAVAAERGWVIGLRHDEDGVAEAIEALIGSLGRVHS